MTFSEIENVQKFKKASSFLSRLPTVGKVGFDSPSQVGFCSHMLHNNIEFSAIKLVTFRS